MANRILISVQDGIEKPEWLDGVEPFVQTVMEKLSYDKEEISVLFCSNEFIQELNKNYRQIDSATDVLSFENGEEYEDEEGVWFCAGDIAVSLDMLPENAEYFAVPKEVDRIYFNNPFSLEILQKVMHKILESYYENPREMKLLFYYPSDEYISYLMTVDEFMFEDEIDCRDLFPGNDMRERIVIFGL